MEESNNKKVARAWLKSLDDCDKEAYYRYTHPGHIQKQNAVDDRETMATEMDIDVHWVGVEKLNETFVMNHPIEEIYEDNDNVIFRGISTGHSRKDPEKLLVTLEYIMILHIVDGMVKEAWSMAKPV